MVKCCIQTYTPVKNIKIYISAVYATVGIGVY